MIGEKYSADVANKTKSFCQEMQMTPDQQMKFEELIITIMKYSLNTSTECANAVGGTRQIKNNIE